MRRKRDGNLPGRIVRWVPRDISLAVFDLIIVLCAYLFALVIRFEGVVPPLYWNGFWTFVALAAVTYLYLNFAFGLYGQMWRYASVREARQVLLAGTVSGIFLVTASELIGGTFRLLPLSVVLLGAVLSLLGFGAVRFQSRLFAFRRRVADQDVRRVLVFGAGDAGAMILRDLQRHPHLGLLPVGVVDDDPRKVGKYIQGIRVVGTRQVIPSLVQRGKIDQVLLATPSATGDVIRRIVALCEEAGVGVLVLPSVREIVNGRVTARDIRDLKIEDLLGRQMVKTDLESVRGLLAGRRILVTGAGGSIGSEIVRQVMEFEPATLVILDRDEIHLHDLLSGLSSEAAAAPIQISLADIRDRDQVLRVFEAHRPEIVFHAAAHKHLPMLEEHPREAILTNVLGTSGVARSALETGAERFVLISTDKAVRPTSVMGASKWLAEQVIWSLVGRGCAFSAVRFGNVLGSRGGVVQTFLRQVANGGPVTVTDPSMARYFMSIQEAVQLVLQAAALSDGGEVFTLEMGQPVRILELAHEIIRISGRDEDDVAISIVGPRPGEKLVEDLLDPEENPGPSAHPDITVSRPTPPDPEALEGVIDRLVSLADQGLEARIAEDLRSVGSGYLGRRQVMDGIG